jgi:hypothetical protein
MPSTKAHALALRIMWLCRGVHYMRDRQCKVHRVHKTPLGVPRYVSGL